MKKFFTKCVGVIMVAVIFLPVFALAQQNATSATDGFGFGNRLDEVAASYNPQNELTLEEKVGNIISIVLSLLGVVFLVLMIYAGFNWMTAGGDEERINKARSTIRAAIIGLVIVIASYALSVFIIENLWGAGI